MNFDSDTDVVDVIRQLRRRTNDNFSVKPIHAVRGVGYVLELKKAGYCRPGQSHVDNGLLFVFRRTLTVAFDDEVDKPSDRQLHMRLFGVKKPYSPLIAAQFDMRQ
jgi:hypothetical protein